jgi:hypothetical protein
MSKLQWKYDRPCSINIGFSQHACICWHPLLVYLNVTGKCQSHFLTRLMPCPSLFIDGEKLEVSRETQRFSVNLPVTMWRWQKKQL